MPIINRIAPAMPTQSGLIIVVLPTLSKMRSTLLAVRLQRLCGLLEEGPSRLRAIDLIGAALERRGKAAEGGVENRAHEQAQGAAAKFVNDEELDLAALLAGGAEAPAVVHGPERAFEILHQNFKLGPVERDAAGERLADKPVGNGHVDN